VPLDRRQGEIHRLLTIFGPTTAAFYADACRLMAGEPPLASTTHLVGHLLRELESAVRQILRPMIPPEQAASLLARRGEEGHHTREIDAIATALGFPPDDEVRSLWRSLRLDRVGHRGSQLGPRPVDDDFRARWDNAQILLLRLGRQFESSFTATLPLIDELAGKQQPTRSDATRLQSVPHSVVALDVFFERAGPGWFPLLRKKGYLRDPPPLEVADDDTIAYVRWPAGRYVARMAAEPILRDVVEVALALETDNPQAHECVAEVALVLPAAEGACLAPKIAGFLASPYQWALPPKARDLAARLAQAGETDAALLLLRSLVEAETGRGGWRSAGLVPELIPAVFPQLGLDGLVLLADLLDQALDERLPAGRTWRDQSYGWQRTLDGGREHDREQTLTSALRDAAVLLARSDPPGVAAVVDVLERRERAIFHRLALHVLRHVPDQALIAERIGRRELFDDFHVEREYTLLLREQAALLPRQIQARVIGWVDAGPQEGELESDAIDRWRLVQLARFGGALPAGQGARYQELVERFGEPAEPELLEGWVGPTAPLSTQELLALRDDELVALLHSWQPDAGGLAPSREGLRGTLEEAAARAPERLASLTPALAELHPAYAVGVLSGLGQAATQGHVVAWQPVLEFAHTMIVGSRSLPVPDEDQDDQLIRGWVDVRLQLARLLDTGLRHDRIPTGADSDVFEVLAALASDPDPSVTDERRRGDGDAGPVTLALTTVRGVAFSAIMQYARWRRTKTPPGQTPRLGRQLRELLDRHLDPKQEPTKTVRSVYGRYFPQLLACDEGWVRSRVEVIFPRHVSLEGPRRAAWDSYLLFNPAYRDAYELLSERYRDAIAGLAEYPGAQPPDRVAEEVREALVGHVLGLYVHGSVGLDSGSLVDLFFGHAPVGTRARLIEAAGEVTAGEQLSPPTLQRLQGLWEWRMSVLREQDQPDLEELEGFGWWFGSGRFDADWALTQLHELLAMGGTVQPDHTVAERLATLRHQHLAQVVGCLSLLIDASYRHAPQRSWFVTGARDEIRAILEDAIRAEEPELVVSPVKPRTGWSHAATPSSEIFSRDRRVPRPRGESRSLVRPVCRAAGQGRWPGVAVYRRRWPAGRSAIRLARQPWRSVRPRSGVGSRGLDGGRPRVHPGRPQTVEWG
jgi:hypothetical protein